MFHRPGWLSTVSVCSTGCGCPAYCPRGSISPIGVQPVRAASSM